jgi:hypothetical protein
MILSSLYESQVWPRSHREVYPLMMEDKYAKMLGNMGMHYVEINALHDTALKDKLRRESLDRARRVPVPAGACLVWSSKTVHQGWSHGPRLAVPICWEPRSRRSPQALNRKIRLCLKRLPTTHWASFGYQHDLSLDLTHPSLPSGLREKKGDDAAEIIPNSLMLPFRGGLVTDYVLREGISVDQYATINHLCSLSEREDDCDDDIGAQMATFLRPEILAVL